MYGRARDAISDQLGVDPGAELRQVHAEPLAKDSAGLAGTISAGRCPLVPGGDPPGTPSMGASPPPPHSPLGPRAGVAPPRTAPAAALPGAAARRRDRFHRA